MFSEPPPTVIFASPSSMARFAIAIATIEEQQARSTVVELASGGMPDASEIWRAIERFAVGMLMPIYVSSTSAGSTAARSIASLTTKEPRATVFSFFITPPNLSNGVRTADTITTFSIFNIPLLSIKSFGYMAFLSWSSFIFSSL